MLFMNLHQYWQNQDKTRIVAFVVLLIIFVATVFLLSYQWRIWLPSDGTLFLWVSDAWSDQNSQHILDPYSFSHLLHGIIFFGLLYPFAKKVSWWRRLNIAMFIEALWEIVENSAVIIDRYRDAGALWYSGDTIVNATGDLLCCLLGFVLAHHLGRKKSLAVFVAVELVLIWAIRDSLLINVIMLIHPIEAIQQWQSVML